VNGTHTLPFLDAERRTRIWRKNDAVARTKTKRYKSQRYTLFRLKETNNTAFNDVN